MITYRETHWAEKVIDRHQEEQAQIQMKEGRSYQNQFIAALLLVILFALVIAIFISVSINSLIPSIP